LHLRHGRGDLKAVVLEPRVIRPVELGNPLLDRGFPVVWRLRGDAQHLARLLRIELMTVRLVGEDRASFNRHDVPVTELDAGPRPQDAGTVLDLEVLLNGVL